MHIWFVTVLDQYIDRLVLLILDKKKMYVYHKQKMVKVFSHTWKDRRECEWMD